MIVAVAAEHFLHPLRKITNESVRRGNLVVNCRRYSVTVIYEVTKEMLPEFSENTPPQKYAPRGRIFCVFSNNTLRGVCLV